MTNYNGYDRQDFIKEIERLKGQRDELIEALQGLMEWQVKNVHKWNNQAYDFAASTLKKIKGES